VDEKEEETLNHDTIYWFFIYPSLVSTFHCISIDPSFFIEFIIIFFFVVVVINVIMEERIVAFSFYKLSPADSTDSLTE
jgi:hypothetical protein